MPEGFIHWYQPHWSAPDVAPMVARLEAAGWTLPNPMTGEALMFGRHGGTPVSREALLDRLALPEGVDSVSTHWWLDGGATDVYYRARRFNGDSVVHEFALDGVSGYLEKIEEDLVDLVRDNASATTGLVIDRWGATEDMDWDPVMAGVDAPIDQIPDVLALIQELDRLHPDLLYRHETYQINGLVIHDWRGLYLPSDPR